MDMKNSILGTRAPERLDRFLDEVGIILNNKRRRASFAVYAAGLLGDASRKSAEPIAAQVCGDATQANAMHYRLLHFLSESAWDDSAVREVAVRYALEAMLEERSVKTWLVDDTGFLKKGTKSPGVQRQYTGSAGKTANSQIGVSLALATDRAHLPIDFELYLPESWTNDRARCDEAHIPPDVEFRPKWQLALDMVDRALKAELPTGTVVADSDYGNKGGFRDALEERGLHYVVGVHSTMTVRPVEVVAGEQRVGERRTLETLAFELGDDEFRHMTWRDGSRGELRDRFAVVPVQDHTGAERRLLVAWPEHELKPTNYALTNLPKATSKREIIRTFKERWRIERCFQDLKGDLGLDHFEGRTFRGWHHHVSVVLCCYAFVVAEQCRAFPPSAARETNGHDQVGRAA